MHSNSFIVFQKSVLHGNNISAEYIVSSANWLILISFPNKQIHLTFVFCISLLAKISAPNINRYGARG